jgi:hypothetical protein
MPPPPLLPTQAGGAGARLHRLVRCLAPALVPSSRGDVLGRGLGLERRHRRAPYRRSRCSRCGPLLPAPKSTCGPPCSPHPSSRLPNRPQTGRRRLRLPLPNRRQLEGSQSMHGSRPAAATVSGLRGARLLQTRFGGSEAASNAVLNFVFRFVTDGRFFASSRRFRVLP